MIAFPPCKINLGLHIIRKRSDGYHELETGFYPVPWTDILEIIPSATLTFTSTGLPIPGSAEDNLCLKAYHLLTRDHDLPPVAIHLHKIVPMGAGLGGGSSDGAHTLRLLNQLFALGLSTEKLMRYASQLGSDCAFFIQDAPMLGTGRGEVLTSISLSLKGQYLVLVKPPVHVSTAQAYAGVMPRDRTSSLANILTRPITEWREQLVNDFETSVFIAFPELGEWKKKLYDAGATYAAMSGSGATLFGIFPSSVQFKAPSAQVWSGPLFA